MTSPHARKALWTTKRVSRGTLCVRCALCMRRNCGRRQVIVMGLTSRGSLQLQVGQVDVWLASLSHVSNSERFAYLQLLSEPEQAQWQRFRVKGAQLQYVVTRALAL